MDGVINGKKIFLLFLSFHTFKLAENSFNYHHIKLNI